VELTTGTVVAERFRLVRMLGEGGMGSVWLAHHEKLDMACAVKFISADVASAEGVRERFEREAKIAAQIKSPHVVQVLDYGVSEGVPYIAMEYLDGQDLAQRLAERGRLSPDEAVSVVAQVARALAKAHAAGLVHRDLKPENVFLVRDDDHELVKVLDFGIAKAQTPMPDVNTRTGTLMGTPRFMSPEQAQGMKNLDHRSDLWSLGVIAFRSIVGVLPFDSDAIGDLMMRIIVHPLPVPSQILPGLPPSFDAWWMRAAARDPAHRFQNAKDLADALSAAFGFASATSGPVLGAPTGGGGTAAMPTPPFSPMYAGSSPHISTADSSGRGTSPSAPFLTPAGYAPLPGRAITPPATGPMTPTMTGAATMLPAQPGAAVPAHTMSPASRTFPGGGSTRKKPVALFAMGGLLVVATVAAVFVLALSDKPAATMATPSDATAVASAASAVPSTAEDPSPAATEPGATGAEPGATGAASAATEPSAQPTASASSPAPKQPPPKATTPTLRAPPTPAARPTAKPKPRTTTPARKGKVKIPPQ
jgi:serine/threonine protein kinase